MELERIFCKAAQAMPCDKVLMICDRGLMDGKVYVTEEEVVLPKELELIREVTDDDAYKNASLAKNG